MTDDVARRSVLMAGPAVALGGALTGAAQAADGLQLSAPQLERAMRFHVLIGPAQEL